MTVQEKQVRKSNQRQAQVLYLVSSDDLTKTYNLCGKGSSDLASRVSSESTIQKTHAHAHAPYIPLIPFLK